MQADCAKKAGQRGHGPCGERAASSHRRGSTRGPHLARSRKAGLAGASESAGTVTWLPSSRDTTQEAVPGAAATTPCRHAPLPMPPLAATQTGVPLDTQSAPIRVAGDAASSSFSVPEATVKGAVPPGARRRVHNRFGIAHRRSPMPEGFQFESREKKTAARPHVNALSSMNSRSVRAIVRPRMEHRQRGALPGAVLDEYREFGPWRFLAACMTPGQTEYW